MPPYVTQNFKHVDEMLAEQKRAKMLGKTVNTAWVGQVTIENPHEVQEEKKEDKFVNELEEQEAAIISELYTGHFKPKQEFEFLQ